MGGFKRVPFERTVRKSPFELLSAHARYVTKTANSLIDAFNSFLNGDEKRFLKIKEEVESLESEADRIKGNIRNHLPKSILMPVDRTMFLMLLSEQDKIIDNIQDIIEWIYMRNRPPREELSENVRELFNQVERTVAAYEKAIGNLKDLVDSSFSEKERSETKEAIWEVHRQESICDSIERSLTKKIFDMEDRMSAGEILHLTKLVMLLGEVANRAENAADRLRALMAR